MTERADLLIRGASELLTLAGGPPGPARGAAMGDLGIVPDGAVAVRGGRVVAAGRSADLERRFAPARVLDAAGRVVLPGFVDPHTHLVFPAPRDEEFEMRCLGKTYEEIAAAGGGIRNSARRMRSTPREVLLENARALRRSALLHGTTTVEVKSGYGLSTESEILLLTVARALDDRGDVVTTFLGAHEVPDEHRADRAEYLRLVIEEMLPRVAERGLARFCDVFCEKGVFSVEDSRRLLLAARARGLLPKLHADELHTTGGAELAAEIGATSADHLIRVSDEGIRALAASDTVAVLLPATSYFLGMKAFAPGRRLVDSGAAVALATDCNPGSSMTENMQFVLTTACLAYRFTVAEAICAATRNAAAAVGLAAEVGTIEPGKRADLLVLDVPRYRLLAYHHGVNHVAAVVHHGEVVA